jgi:hypothetical protein
MSFAKMRKKIQALDPGNRPFHTGETGGKNDLVRMKNPRHWFCNRISMAKRRKGSGT